MNIVFYCPRTLPVKKYGGTERVIYWLMKELARTNKVTLIGTPDSNVASINVSLIPCASKTDWRSLIPHDTDIVHTDGNSLVQCDIAQASIDIDFPYINTIHGNESLGSVFPQNTVFVSKNHARRHNSDQYVYNGIDLDEYPLVRTRKNQNRNFMFLANGRWDIKNLHDCITACETAKKNLFVCGADRKDSFRVFRNRGTGPLKALPYALSSRMHFRGMISQNEKLPLFSKTDVFLWPVLWHEPFGLAVIEAFSQGIPVYASPYGSLPELVPETCGALVKNYGELLNTIISPPREYDPKVIRQHCIDNFSSSVMAKNYYRMYERVVSGETLNPVAPRVSESHNPTERLLF
jgi:Glycosyltransferase